MKHHRIARKRGGARTFRSAEIRKLSSVSESSPPLGKSNPAADWKIRAPFPLPSVFILILALAYNLTLSAAERLSDESLASIHFDQKLNAQITTGLAFQDEHGKTVRLGDYFGKKPVVLVLGYYRCPMLCGLVLNGMVETMQDLRWTIGKEFSVVNVSIDPHETPKLAAAKKRACLKRYGRPEADAGWSFLTGDDASIRRIAGEVGFQFAYDETAKQYAHPSGFVILTPDGKVSRYFLGVTFSAKDLHAALQAASRRGIGTRIQNLVLLCFHYSPVTSKYGAAIMLAVRALGLVTVLALAVLIIRGTRNRALRNTQYATRNVSSATATSPASPPVSPVTHQTQ